MKGVTSSVSVYDAVLERGTGRMPFYTPQIISFIIAKMGSPSPQKFGRSFKSGKIYSSEFTRRGGTNFVASRFQRQLRLVGKASCLSDSASVGEDALSDRQDAYPTEF